MSPFDIFGLCLILFLFVSSLIGSIYLFVYFCSPFDKDLPGAYIIKTFIITGSTLIFMIPFLIVYDILSTYQLLSN